MRALVALAVIALAISVGGCRKKFAREFYDLESRATILEARDGDEGLLSDEMSTIIAGLKAIPAEAVEGPKAKALYEKIEADRRALVEKRLAAEKERNTPPPPAPSLIETPATPPARAEVPEAPDAGPSMPWGNMTLEEFQRRFGVCMESAGEKESSGHGRLKAFEVTHTPTCVVKYSLDDSTQRFYLFKEGRLAEERTERQTITIIDAGTIRTLVPREAPGPYVMGMPTPGQADAQ